MNDYNNSFETRSLTLDVIKVCWWLVVLYIVATGINSMFTDNEIWLFIRNVTIIPSLKMAVVWSVVHFYIQRNGRYSEYVLLFGLNILMCIMILALYELAISIYLLVFPILISLFYFRKNLIRFVFAQQMISLMSLYLFSMNLRNTLSFSNLSMVICMLIGTAMVISSLRNKASNLSSHLVNVIQEKQDLHTKNILMEKLNRVDPATGLYNHRSFHEHLDNILSVQGSFPFTLHLALLDIDNFKQVNDTFGHACGDVIIKFVADQIMESMEPDDFASRYGGEEFAILSVGKTTEQFYTQVEKIREVIAKKKHEELTGKSISVSIGIQKLEPGMNKQKLFTCADTSLYLAKKSGKNQTVHTI